MGEVYSLCTMQKHHMYKLVTTHTRTHTHIYKNTLGYYGKQSYTGVNKLLLVKCVCKRGKEMERHFPPHPLTHILSNAGRREGDGGGGGGNLAPSSRSPGLLNERY